MLAQPVYSMSQIAPSCLGAQCVEMNLWRVGRNVTAENALTHAVMPQHAN
ncbi:unnamed protein product [Staurois parvus]|uniref:Uncharacterized protein n=1 Tax=Staurois parvus TaxID=386267 RepID=A0ABN9DCM2_9NEOB|nr:unnamed protein product [Staurois parvus]